MNDSDIILRIIGFLFLENWKETESSPAKLECQGKRKFRVIETNIVGNRSNDIVIGKSPWRRHFQKRNDFYTLDRSVRTIALYSS